MATTAYRNDRIRLLTRNEGSSMLPAAISSSAATPINKGVRHAGEASARKRNIALESATGESLRRETQQQRRKHCNGQPAKYRIDERADRHLRPAEDEARNGQTDERRT